jgi:2-polyprenyl-3-methyl-5-hydroxy-6-metoxy-1,4-benzoquinol methylase
VLLITTLPASYISCPLCGNQQLQPRWKVNEYPIVACPGCSLLFVNKIVTMDELAAHYATVIDPSYEEDNVECLNYYHDRLRKLIEAHHPKAGRILDIGCSGGWFLDAMPGWECHGNEISESNAALARERHGDRIFAGSFDEYPMRDEYFDVITLQDVFDHMRDPIETLRKCRAMLKPHGLLVIKVHNISCLYAKLSGKRFYAVVPPSHLFYYNKRTLKLALEKTGFQMTDSRFIAHLLRAHTVLLRLAQSNTGSVFYRLYRMVEGSWLGKLTIKKNLHDVITVLAVRD